MIHKRFSLLPRKIQILILIYVCLLSSCTNLPLPLLPESANKAQAEAELLFINGNFGQALTEYQQIYRTAVSPKDQTSALYGIACSQMMMSRSDEQFVEAIGTLQKWDAGKGTAAMTENRHLLLLALKQQSNLIVEKNKVLASIEERKNSVISNQKKKISQMSFTLKELQKQLKELETIDESFQEKRKPL